MRKVNYLTVAASSLAAFIASAVYYAIFGSTYAQLRGIDPEDPANSPSSWTVAAQFARNLIVAFVFTYLIKRFGIEGWKNALSFGLFVWLGFQAMQIAGSVIHENYPIGLYALHVGDALLTTVLITVIIGIWPGRKENKNA